MVLFFSVFLFFLSLPLTTKDSNESHCAIKKGPSSLVMGVAIRAAMGSLSPF